MEDGDRMQAGRTEAPARPVGQEEGPGRSQAGWEGERVRQKAQACAQQYAAAPSGQEADTAPASGNTAGRPHFLRTVQWDVYMDSGRVGRQKRHDSPFGDYIL